MNLKLWIMEGKPRQRNIIRRTRSAVDDYPQQLQVYASHRDERMKYFLALTEPAYKSQRYVFIPRPWFTEPTNRIA